MLKSLPKDQMLYVLGHNYSYIDLDSLISSVILAEILSALGCTVRAVTLEPDRIKASTLEIIKEIGNIEIPPAVSKAELERGELILVDHNDPRESYARLEIGKSPYLILDHHVDSGTAVVAEKRIENVGSTCTLLVELSQNEDLRLSDRQARALAFTIIVDTRGLKGRKTTERDIAAVNQLYKDYEIGESVARIAEIGLSRINLQASSVDEILQRSLKEYLGGTMAIAAVETAEDSYRDRIEAIQSKGQQMPYALYVLMIIKHHTQETEILYFDHRFGIFPREEIRQGLVSRGKELAPEILESIAGAGLGVVSGV